ncbi:MAG: hypothetical protein IKU02_02335 [Bacteroidaceae bacterium]|nr:hypothetical protein [Bacteroidaceae bacterium]
MDNEYLEIANKIDEVERFVEKKKWPCLCPNCQKAAINSHLLQRNGILDNVAENGHLYEARIKDVYRRINDDEIVEIKKVGIGQAISYPLFCSEHDSALFKPIEGKLIDFDDYHSQLLFSYRSLCSEIRKKEFNIERYNGTLIEDNVKFELLLGEKLGLEDLRYYKGVFETEIVKPQNKFTFLHLTYPFIPVFASGTSTYFMFDDTFVNFTEGIQNGQIIDCFFINIIPQKNSLEIIIGYNNEHTNDCLDKFTQSWKNLSTNQLLNKIVDLFNYSIESWGMSPSFYKRLLEKKLIE